VYDSKSPIVPSSASFSLCGVHPIERWTPYAEYSLAIPGYMSEGEKNLRRESNVIETIANQQERPSIKRFMCIPPRICFFVQQYLLCWQTAFSAPSTKISPSPATSLLQYLKTRILRCSSSQYDLLQSLSRLDLRETHFQVRIGFTPGFQPGHRHPPRLFLAEGILRTMPSLRQGLETGGFENPTTFAYEGFISYGFPVISGNTFSVVVSLVD
jgi:hypothetical protein